LLGPGTFNLTSAIDFNHKSNIALRGSGADQTLLVFSGSSSAQFCGEGANIGLVSSDCTYAGSPPANIYNWTAGYAQGTTQITLSSVANIVPNQTLLMLDQCNDGYTGAPCAGSAIDTHQLFVCDEAYTGSTGCGSSDPTNAYRQHRSQIHMAVATAVSGNTVTIWPPLHMPNWRAGQSPQVWLLQPMVQSGVENLSVNSQDTGSTSFLIYNCYECWVSGTRSINPDKSHVEVINGMRSVIKDNYFYQASNSDPYGIFMFSEGSSLVQNNIVQQVRSAIVVNGPSSGSVYAYNFTIDDDQGGSFMWFSHWNHSAGIGMTLSEGNIGNGYANDDIHGSHHFITRFRNYYNGWESGASSQTNAMFEAAYNRYSNVIGNVLGRSGYHTQYQDTSSNSSLAVYILGYGNCCTTPPIPTDPLVNSTAMRWGNYDTVNGAVRWVSSEVPSGINPYPNPVPSTHTLPPSFYLSAKPAWFGSTAWPPIGPDVTGGNIPSVGGYANYNPAASCFLNVMHGPADGSGGVLTFNANTCYGQTGDPPGPPSNLVATPQ
jgi:hypothetical protein